MLDSSEALTHNFELLRPFVAPLLVYRKGETDATKTLTGGTVFFAQTTSNRFLVTAAHVMLHIENLRKEFEVDVFLGANGGSPLEIGF